MELAKEFKKGKWKSAGTKCIRNWAISGYALWLAMVIWEYSILLSDYWETQLPFFIIKSVFCIFFWKFFAQAV